MGIRVVAGAAALFLAISIPLVSVAESESAAEEGPSISWVPERPRQGDALAVSLRVAAPIRGASGRFIDKDLIFFPWGEESWMAFAPIPVGARTGPRDLDVTVYLEDGTEVQEKASVRLFGQDFDESVLRVDPRFTRPPEEERPRIRRDREKIRQAFAESLEERIWRVPFVRPAEGVRTGRFGTRRTFNGAVRSRHMGLDLDGSRGDPIYALTDGRVVLAYDLFYSGLSVFLDHGHEFFTVYFHMTDVEVEVGELVRAGQRIGTIGASGRVTGPHLHVGVRLQGRYVDPERFLELALGEDPAGSAPEQRVTEAQAEDAQ